jgi:hypothetical protein
VLLLALDAAASGRVVSAAAVSLQWSVMTDAFGTRVDYPSGIFTIEQGSPPRGTGRVLESAEREARLMVYVEENEEHHSPASFVRSNLSTWRLVPRPPLTVSIATRLTWSLLISNCPRENLAVRYWPG